MILYFVVLLFSINNIKYGVSMYSGSQWSSSIRGIQHIIVVTSQMATAFAAGGTAGALAYLADAGVFIRMSEHVTVTQ